MSSYNVITNLIKSIKLSLACGFFGKTGRKQKSTTTSFLTKIILEAFKQYIECPSHKMRFYEWTSF